MMTGFIKRVEYTAPFHRFVTVIIAVISDVRIVYCTYKMRIHRNS